MSGYERTNWRDEMISKWHRTIGINCPAVDIDFLLIEFDHAKPVALIEYKHEFASTNYDENSASIRAIANLGVAAAIPVWVVFYKADLSKFILHPQNNQARNWTRKSVSLTPEQYTRFLYLIRGRKAPTQEQK